MYIKESNQGVKQVRLTKEIIEVGGEIKEKTKSIVGEVCGNHADLVGLVVSCDWLIRFYKSQNVICQLNQNELIITLTDSLIKRASTARKGYTQRQVNMAKLYTGEKKGSIRRLRQMKMSLATYIEFKSQGNKSISNKKTSTAKKTTEKQRDSQRFFKSREWRQLRYDVLKLHGRKCQCCGATPETAVLHVDHIKPRSKYPELQLSIDNLQVLCEDCNFGKSNLHEDDFR